MTAIYPISASIMPQLIAEAAKDNHIVIAPTHVIRKGDDIVGYASVGGMPLVHWWLDTKKGTAIDTVRIQKECEKALKNTGVNVYQILCSNESPYILVMEKLGYKLLGQSNLYVKEI